MSERAPIACLGAGRMARGIAVAFAYAGHSVTIIDVKRRDTVGYAGTCKQAIGEVEVTLRTMAGFGLFSESAARQIVQRVSVVREDDAAAALVVAPVIFECVPEVLDLKREVLARASATAGPEPIIASTTSTILVDDLSSAVVASDQSKISKSTALQYRDGLLIALLAVIAVRRRTVTALRTGRQLVRSGNLWALEIPPEDLKGKRALAVC